MKKRCIICNKNILCELYKKGSAKCNKCLYQLRKDYLLKYSKTQKAKDARKKWYFKKREEKKQKLIKINTDKINLKRYIFESKPFLNVVRIYGEL